MNGNDRFCLAIYSIASHRRSIVASLSLSLSLSEEFRFRPGIICNANGTPAPFAVTRGSSSFRRRTRPERNLAGTNRMAIDEARLIASIRLRAGEDSRDANARV